MILLRLGQSRVLLSLSLLHSVALLLSLLLSRSRACARARSFSRSLSHPRSLSICHGLSVSFWGWVCVYKRRRWMFDRDSNRKKERSKNKRKQTTAKKISATRSKIKWSILSPRQKRGHTTRVREIQHACPWGRKGTKMRSTCRSLVWKCKALLRPKNWGSCESAHAEFDPKIFS